LSWVTSFYRSRNTCAHQSGKRAGTAERHLLVLKIKGIMPRVGGRFFFSWPPTTFLVLSLNSVAACAVLKKIINDRLVLVWSRCKFGSMVQR